MKKVLGLGNALTDILLQLENDAVLADMNLPKGSMQLVDEQQQSNISSKLKDISRKMVAGGSASNTVNGITRLGGNAGFIGKVGRDDVGEFYIADSKENGIVPHFLESGTPSGRCLVLISKDGERTMCTFLGAASELTLADLHQDMYDGYDIFHIEGYLVQNQELIREAVKQAKEKGLKVSIDLASYNVVEGNLAFLQEIVREYVDIVFANEEEAKAFTGKNPREALEVLAEIVPVAIVKVGEQGSYVKSDGQVHFIEAVKTNVVDTTGAGDLYAAGFLYGLSCGQPLDICGKIGSLVAANAVSVIGPKLDEKSWSAIRKEIEQIIQNA